MTTFTRCLRWSRLALQLLLGRGRAAAASSRAVGGVGAYAANQSAPRREAHFLMLGQAATYLGDPAFCFSCGASPRRSASVR